MRKWSLLLLSPFLLHCSSSNTYRPSNGFSGIQRANSTYAPTSEGQNQRLIDQGFAHYWKGDYARAATQLEAAFLLDAAPAQSWARYILFYCYLSIGRYEDALSVAETIVKERPHESLGYQQVGLAQLWLGRIVASRSNFKRALEFENHAPILYFYLGLADERMGGFKRRNENFAKAESEYLQILQSNPQDFDSNYELASLYIYWGRKRAMVPNLLKAAKAALSLDREENLAPEKELYLNFYLPRLEGMHLSLTGKPQEALDQFFHSIANAPSGAKSDLAEIYLYMGKSYMALGNKENSSSFLYRAKSLDPTGPYSAQIARQISNLSSMKKSFP